MASYLLDTNILVARINSLDPSHGETLDVLTALALRHHRMLITPQVLIEFHRVCTRPGGAGGLGMTHEEAIAQRVRAARLFQLVPETPDIFAQWEGILNAVDVRGKQVHDARIAAVCLAAGIDSLLTYNGADFARYARLFPRFSAVSPSDIVRGAGLAEARE